MQLFEMNLNNARPIADYGAIGVSAAGLLELSNDVAVNILRFSPRSVLPEHQAGRPQLFLVLQGDGWVSGADGTRSNIRAGQAVHWAAGELHGSGTESGMLCVRSRRTQPARRSIAGRSRCWCLLAARLVLRGGSAKIGPCGGSSAAPTGL